MSPISSLGLTCLTIEACGPACKILSSKRCDYNHLSTRDIFTTFRRGVLAPQWMGISYTCRCFPDVSDPSLRMRWSSHWKSVNTPSSARAFWAASSFISNLKHQKTHLTKCCNGDFENLHETKSTLSPETRALKRCRSFPQGTNLFVVTRVSHYCHPG